MERERECCVNYKQGRPGSFHSYPLAALRLPCPRLAYLEDKRPHEARGSTKSQYQPPIGSDGNLCYSAPAELPDGCSYMRNPR